MSWKRRVGLRHRAISQVVPSLESLMTTPIAASSSRMRSDSLKSFRARAAVRSEIKPSICFGSMPLACCFRPFQSAALSDRKPRSRNEAANSLRSCSAPDAALLRRLCNEVIICGVLRSSDNASMTASEGISPLASAAIQYQSSSVFALSSMAFSVHAIGVERAGALREFVLVVRKHQIDAAAMDVELFAEMFPRHRRAFDVPARTALHRDAGRRRP